MQYTDADGVVWSVCEDGAMRAVIMPPVACPGCKAVHAFFISWGTGMLCTGCDAAQQTKNFQTTSREAP